MSIIFTIDGVTVLDSDRVRLDGTDNAEDMGFTSSAVSGGQDTAHIRIEDPEGDLDIQMMHFFQVDEDDCVGFERIWTGLVIGITQSYGPYEVGPGCVWDLDIAGVNSWAGLRVLSDRDNAKRPAETNFDRIEWLFGTTACTDLIFRDPTFVTGTELDMPADDLRGKTPAEVLDSMGGELGRNWFIFVDPDTLQATLWYGPFNNGVSDSTLEVSNDPTEWDLTDIFPPLETSLFKDGSEIYSHVLVRFRGQQTFVARTATAVAYVDRHAVVDNDRIGRLDTAIEFGGRWLEEHKAPRDTITFGLELPADKVNLLREGQRVDVTFLQLPEYNVPTTVCVRRRTVSQLPTGNPAIYLVTYECSATSVSGTIGGGDPGDFPFEPATCDVGSVAIVQSNHDFVTLGSGANSIKGASWGSPPTQGNLLLMAFMPVGAPPAADAGDFPGWTEIQRNSAFLGTGGAGGSIQTYWKIAEASEVTQPESDIGSSNYGAGGINSNNAYLFEVSGVDALDTFAEDIQGSPTVANTIGVSITPTAGKVAILFGLFEVNQASGFAFPITPGSGITELYEESAISGGGNPGRWIGYRIVDGTTGSYFMGGTEAIPGAEFDWGAVAISFICTAADNPPPPGTSVPHEVVGDGDGTTTVFFTNFPYADHSLRVWVDGVQIINGLTESDPETGEFTLDFAPHGVMGDTAAEVVTASYQGR